MAHHQDYKPLHSITVENIQALGISSDAAAQLHLKLTEIVATYGADATKTWQHISQHLLTPDIPFSFHQMMYYGCYINFGPDPPAWLPDPLYLHHGRNLPINTVEDNQVGDGFAMQNKKGRIAMIMRNREKWRMYIDILVPQLSVQKLIITDLYETVPE